MNVPQLDFVIADAMVDRAFARFAECCIATRECPKCKGEGYHHGFGTHSHDPDWCENCHGSQHVAQYSDREAMRLAILAALSGEPTPTMVEAGARAICALTGDDPDKKTYAHEMKCTGHDREPEHRWEYWTPFARAVLGSLAQPAQGSEP